ncbi:MAG: NAD(P)/FAD-dependent oxidoreductase [Kiritimatiellae bacterium]|nr:NAD(P)/FAD-dependent oxidoreductase [Kiritimatiellia bacterium]MDW8459425.1 NAD(P)/FAD-dependent oxidoreductase [Verrucomicrobiota bacterium]
MTLRIAIAGGGAAGFFAAIRAAEENRRAEVLLFERSPEPLAKVAISGGGRCNVTHHCFDIDRLVQHYPRGARELIGPFHRFQPKDTVEWFESRGVRLKVEPDGRIFPVSDRSASIVQCLLREAERLGVQLFLGTPVESVRSFPGGGFELDLQRGQRVQADRVLLATGGNRATAGYRLAASLGHTIVEPVPSLFSFHIPDSSLHRLSGISVPDARISAEGPVPEQAGPLLVTHWGISGPAVLKLSAWGARAFAACDYCTTLNVCWQSDGRGRRREAIAEERRRHPARSLVARPLIRVPARLWEWILERANIPGDRMWSHLSNAEANRLADACDRMSLETAGKSLFKDEFVTCGGVSLKEVDFRTMQSKCCPGLYFAGELLDIDALTGGFNLQAAWTTGWIAGEAMARG